MLHTAVPRATAGRPAPCPANPPTGNGVGLPRWEDGALGASAAMTVSARPVTDWTRCADWPITQTNVTPVAVVVDGRNDEGY